MTEQLPAILQSGALVASTDTYIVPALIADLGDQASWRYVEFFTANINNDHTHRAHPWHRSGLWHRLARRTATPAPWVDCGV